MGNLDEHEQEKYVNYKELKDPEERKEYAAETVTGAFSIVMWNKDDVAVYKATKKVWLDALSNKDNWLQISNGWYDRGQKNIFERHRKKNKKSSIGYSDGFDDTENGGRLDMDDDGVEFFLLGDEGFDHNHAHNCRGVMMPMRKGMQLGMVV